MTKKEKRRKYYRLWYKIKGRKYGKKYRRLHHEEILYRQKIYRQKHQKEITKYYRLWYKINGRKRSKKQIKNILKWQNNNLKKRRAAWILNRYLRSHPNFKPLKCVICKEQHKLLAHHKNYNKPLDVIWVCYSCHKRILHGDKCKIHA